MFWKRSVARTLCLLVVGLSFGGTGWLAAPTRARAEGACNASIGNANFGSTISPLTAGVVDTSATLTFSCTGMTPGLGITLCPSLDAGSSGTNGAGGRYLKTAGGQVLSYQIYQDAARTQTWGSASLLAFGATPTITGTPGSNGAFTVTQTLYARLWTTATTPPGAYSTSFANQGFFWGLNLLTCAGVTIGFAAPPATFTFNATLVPDCQISSSAVNFGSVGVLTANKDAQGAVAVTCTAGSTYNIGLNNGQTGTGPTQRKMTKGGEAVTYGLYKNAARDQPWGQAAEGAAYVSGGTGTGAVQSMTVYGRAPAQSTPSPGAYADLVVATVTY